MFFFFFFKVFQKKKVAVLQEKVLLVGAYLVRVALVKLTGSEKRKINEELEKAHGQAFREGRYWYFWVDKTFLNRFSSANLESPANSPGSIDLREFAPSPMAKKIYCRTNTSDQASGETTTENSKPERDYHHPSAFKLYLREIAKHPLLSEDEVAKLSNRYQQGDLTARDQLVKNNLKLVVSIAKKIFRHGMTIEDLVSAGNFGLFKAAEGFKPELGCRFSTYATLLIKHEIIREIDNNGMVVRLPVERIQDIRTWNKLYRKYQQSGAKTYFETYVAGETGWKLAKLRRVESDSFSYSLTLSLDAPLAMNRNDDGKERREGNLLGLIADSRIADVVDVLDKKNKLEAIEEIVDSGFIEGKKRIQFTDKEKITLTRRFGLFDAASEETLEEIARDFHLSRERVRQIETKGLRKLRRILSLKGYLVEETE